MTSNQNKNILDTDAPNINVPLLKPTKYIKPKEKKSTVNKVQEEVINLFDKYK